MGPFEFDKCHYELTKVALEFYLDWLHTLDNPEEHCDVIELTYEAIQIVNESIQFYEKFD